jgi:hypothetical protein
MGQYFIPTNITKKIAITRQAKPPVINGGNSASWSDLLGFLKIMEHGYKTNAQVMLFLDKLQNEWFGDQIVWHGDYATNSEYSHEEEVKKWTDVTAGVMPYAPYWKMEQLYELNNWDDMVLLQPAVSVDTAIDLWYSDKVLANLDDGCYIHLGEHSQLSEISPLPLLTSTSTGDEPYIDAGRYAGANIDLMGVWCGKRLAVMSEDALRENYPGFEKWNVVFTDEAGGTVAISADDAENMMATILGNKGEANEKTGEFITYSEALITPLPKIQVTKLSDVIGAAMQTVEGLAAYYWKEVDEYFGVTPDMLRLLPRRTLLYIKNVFEMSRVKNEAIQAVRNHVDNAQSKLNVLLTGAGIKSAGMFGELPRLDSSWKRNENDIMLETIEFITGFLIKQSGDELRGMRSIHDALSSYYEWDPEAKKQVERPAKYNFDAAGYVQALLDKMSGRTFGEIIREERIKLFERNDKTISANGKAVEIVDAHDIGGKYASYRIERDTEDFRHKLSQYLSAVFDDDAARIDRVLNFGELTPFGEEDGCHFAHEYLESVRVFKNRKVRLTFRKKKYASMVLGEQEIAQLSA